MPSPLLHAPSLAQHRFIVLMALWFLGSAAWALFDWWALRETSGLVSAAATAGMTALQIISQARLLDRLKQWRLTGRLKFYAAAGFVTLLLVVFQFGVAIAEGEPNLVFARREWLLLQGTSLLAWYAVWWGALERGWMHASTGLTVAGVHGILLGTFWGWPPVPDTEWLRAIPFRFFAGWCLMFLPSAVAAIESVPNKRPGGLQFRRVVAFVAPVIAASIPALFLAWFMAGAHG